MYPIVNFNSVLKFNLKDSQHKFRKGQVRQEKLRGHLNLIVEVNPTTLWQKSTDVEKIHL